VNRVQWQQFAEKWLVDAKVSLDDRRWHAAYYLAGYAVECGLKACILVRLTATPEVIFENRKFGENCWTHNVMELVKLADLERTRVADSAVNRALKMNWVVVKDWSEQARYKAIVHHKAKKLYAAIADKPHGVMQWIKAPW
jgi:HEPN domain-containing protein